MCIRHRHHFEASLLSPLWSSLSSTSSSSSSSLSSSTPSSSLSSSSSSHRHHLRHRIIIIIVAIIIINNIIQVMTLLIHVAQSRTRSLVVLVAITTRQLYLQQHKHSSDTDACRCLAVPGRWSAGAGVHRCRSGWHVNGAWPTGGRGSLHGREEEWLFYESHRQGERNGIKLRFNY